VKISGGLTQIAGGDGRNPMSSLPAISVVPVGENAPASSSNLSQSTGKDLAASGHDIAFNIVATGFAADDRSLLREGRAWMRIPPRVANACGGNPLGSDIVATLGSDVAQRPVLALRLDSIPLKQPLARDDRRSKGIRELHR